MAGSWPKFAERLKTAREESQLAIEVAAQRSGIPIARWRELESGEDEPSFREGLSIAELLGLSPDWAMEPLKRDLR